MRPLVYVLFWAACAAAMAPAAALAADWTVTPSARSSFFMDDNVFLEGESGYGWSYGADLSLQRETRRTSFVLLSTADFQDFMEDSDFDRFNHSHNALFTAQLSRRFTSSTSADVRVSEAQGQTLLEQGIETDDSTRYDVNVSQSLSYSLTKLMSLTGSYSYRNQISENEELTDSRSHTGSLSLSRTFSKRTTGSLTGSYTFTRYDDTEEVAFIGQPLSDFPDHALIPVGRTTSGTTVYTTVGALEDQGVTVLPTFGLATVPGVEETMWSLDASATHEAGKRLSLTGNVGVSLVDSDLDETTVYNGGVGASYRLRPGTISLAVDRSINQTVFTGSTVSNRATLDFSGYQPLRNLTLSCGLGYFNTKTITDANDESNESVTFNTGVGYAIPISRHWNANLDYSFLYYYDLDDESSDTNNRISLGISWSLPYKL